MRRLLVVSLLLCLGACKGSKGKTGADKLDADAKSGPDGKRSGARVIQPNTPVTDEVNFTGQDKTDWYVVELKGKPGVLNTTIHWDSDQSDVMIDVFDEFGKQISASPVRNKLAKEKVLLTQIDKVGVYYVRVTAPTRADGTVYTMEAKWDVPEEQPPPVQPPPTVTIEKDPVKRPRGPREPREREPKEPREPKAVEKPTGETVQGRVVAAYREGNALTLHLDKGSAAGIRVGMSGTVLYGPSGEDPLEGGEFKVTEVLDGSKSLARSSMRSLGRNNRFMIRLGH